MLKKKYRLLKETSFEKKFTYTSPFFVLKIAKNEKTFSRFGFIVSKKTDNRAVIRNRAKRQIRRVIEENLSQIVTGYDILFILKKQIVNKTTKEINLLTLGEFKKLKLLK